MDHPSKAADGTAFGNRPADRKALTLGVTGGIGSGKTTVCGLLQQHGARVFIADIVAKHLMQTDPGLVADIKELLGPEAYQTDGTLNRPFIAGKVFHHKDTLAELNAIVHPRVRQSLLDAKTEVETGTCGLLVYEAALLLETGGAKAVDLVLVVMAPENTRVDRVQARDGSDAGQVRARMANQMHPAEMAALADYVIQNDGDLQALEIKVAELVKRLLASGEKPENKPVWI